MKFRRRGFTLMELLIVMLIIAVLAALALTALQGAAEDARADRTRAIIAKLDQLLLERYNAYRTRALPIRVPPGMSPQIAAQFRLAGIRDLMRMELPDRITDVVDPPADIDPRAGMRAYFTSPPGPAAPAPYTAMQRTYLRKANVATGNNISAWTNTSQGAECLYLIVSTMHDGDKNALDFFMPGEIGDVDGDGMREVLDGWGRPIEFLRWAPGFVVQNGVLTLQTTDATVAPDPFDPLKVAGPTYALRPLIFSGGRDKSLDIFTDNATGDVPAPPAASVPYRYCPPGAPPDNNFPNPYAPFNAGGPYYAGMPMDRDGDGPEWADNITNHYQPTNGP